MSNAFINMLMPFFTYGLYAIIFLLIVGGGAWYFFVYLNRRRWYANIWEKRGGQAILTDKDLVVEKRIKGKNAHVYILRKRKYPVQPIKEDDIITFKRKDYVDYLRVGSDYIPFKHSFNFNEEGAEHVYQVMPYDVQMQMISTDKLVDEIFKQKEGWFQQYGYMIGFGLLIILTIILMNLYYDFVTSSLEPVKEATNALQSIAQNIIGS